jgi:NAD(P)-dependent dehydrogenase (short-subunit alcohol dehydrogenase family)
VSRAALVTGAAMGMGMLMARKLSMRGWRVFAGVVPGADTRELTQGVDLTVIDQDVTDDVMVREGAEHVTRALAGEGLDLLINNAGIANMATGPLEGVALEEARRLFEVNLWGQLRVLQAYLPLLHRSRQTPRVLNFASGAVRVPMPCSGVYNMSKYAVEGMTNTLRYELRRFGIQVTSIEPGAVKTPMTANPVESTAVIWQKASPAIRERYEAHLRPVTEALGRMLLTANDPDTVTDEVLRLIELPRLAPRYGVGREMKLLPLLQKLLPDTVFEKMIARQFNL